MLALFEGEERDRNHKIEINILATSTTLAILQLVTSSPEKIKLRAATETSHSELIWK